MTSVVSTFKESLQLSVGGKTHIWVTMMKDENGRAVSHWFGAVAVQGGEESNSY